MKQLAALCLFLVLALSAVAQTVTGTITVNGKKTELDHVVAIRKDGNVRILISSRAVTPAQLADTFAMHELNDLSGVEVEITPEGQIPTGMIYSPLLTKFGGSFSSPGRHEWEGSRSGGTNDRKVPDPK